MSKTSKSTVSAPEATFPLKVAQQALAITFQINRPVVLVGQPGIGKTAFIKALWNVLYPGAPCIVMTPALHDPADINGYPWPSNGHMQMLPPAWARRLADAPVGALFFDELSRATFAVQAACLRVFHEGVVGELELGPGIRRCAAMNPPSTVSGALPLSADLANRLVYLDWPVDVNAWIDGMLGGWPAPSPIRVPDTWTSFRPLAASKVAGFAKVRPLLIQAQPEDEESRSRPWPSLRTWDCVAELEAACTAARASLDVRMALIAGAVGVGPASEYLTWERDLDLPDPEALLANPASFRLPERSDQQFAVLASVAAATLSNITRARGEAAWKIMAAAARAGAADVAAGAVRSLADIVGVNPAMPLPTTEVRPFIPILRKAGIVP